MDRIGIVDSIQFVFLESFLLDQLSLSDQSFPFIFRSIFFSFIFLPVFPCICIYSFAGVAHLRVPLRARARATVAARARNARVPRAYLHAAAQHVAHQLRSARSNATCRRRLRTACSAATVICMRAGARTSRARARACFLYLSILLAARALSSRVAARARMISSSHLNGGDGGRASMIMSSCLLSSSSSSAALVCGGISPSRRGGGRAGVGNKSSLSAAGRQAGRATTDGTLWRRWRARVGVATTTAARTAWAILCSSHHPHIFWNYCSAVPSLMSVSAHKYLSENRRYRTAYELFVMWHVQPASSPFLSPGIKLKSDISQCRLCM